MSAFRCGKARAEAGVTCRTLAGCPSPWETGREAKSLRQDASPG